MVIRLQQDRILRLIEEHVKRNIVKIGPHFYLQKSGIAQGSVLSPLLCSVFFGHLDEHILMPLLQQIPQPDLSLRNELNSQREGKTELLDTLEVPKVLENDETILLRLIDDSLFISTSQSSVARFVQLMHNGFEEYGCHANQQKTAVSFDLLLNKNQVKKAHGVYMTNDGASYMRWSGLLINCCTLEVQADYTRCSYLPPFSYQL
jgi:telomerase reverse transcriptase